jgi:hypothetical protein
MTLEMMFEALATALAERVAQKIDEREEGRITQRSRKSLGKRRHPAAVRRRIREGQGGAYIIGRDFVLTPEALREELERFGPRGFEDGDDELAPTPRKNPKPRTPSNAEAEALRKELDRELDALGEATTRRGTAKKTPPKR